MLIPGALRSDPLQPERLRLRVPEEILASIQAVYREQR